MSDGEKKTARIGASGEDESDKDYCLRMVTQHRKLASAVFERLLYGGINPDRLDPVEVEQVVRAGNILPSPRDVVWPLEASVETVEEATDHE